MKKYLLIIAMITATFANAGTRTDPTIVKTSDNIYYKYEVVTLSNNTKTVNYACFTGFPNNPHTNKTQNWLALGYKKGSVGLSSTMKSMCRNYIAFNAS